MIFALTEEGVYNLGVSIGSGQPVTFELPVFLAQETQQAGIH